ncbi:MAG TPA: hypothetical protein VG435_19215 [Acidimicrobiales bacterium]|jgi:hypothetical protein|nr:hypothetical protein [Acidimicrobiales bacterium]
MGAIEETEYGMPESACNTHEDHDHEHGPDCGHESVEHEDHIDYIHDGHRHFAHEGHWDEHEAVTE